MPTSTSRLADALRESMLRFLWRQWSAIGVAGSARTKGTSIIDPEALLLLSTHFARHDARLFDEIIDWLEQHGNLISLVRLSRMLKTEAFGEPTVLAAIAEHLGGNSTLPKWHSLQKNVTPVAPRQPLFPGLPVIREADSAFAVWGWERERLATRGMSRSPLVDQPATALFSLRSLFGRQARAELLAWFLCHESGHPARIARETAYYRRTVQQVLNEWEAGGHVRSFRQGREKVFALQRDRWTPLLKGLGGSEHDGAGLQWIQWPPLFTAIQRFAIAVDRTPDNESDALAAIRFRDLLQELIPDMHRAGLATRMQSHPGLKGRALVEAMIQDMQGLLD